ncbi:bombyxin A-7, partial [Trichinella spiralis]
SENFDDAIYGNAVADDCLTSLEETDFGHRGAHRLKRARRGIVEECCIRSCSYAYMRSFCCNNQ